MKKLFVSVGLIAAGTASLQAAYAPDWNSTSASMWSVSGTLRGFYDDNYTTAPSGSKVGSYGLEVTPQVSLNVPLQQTELGMRYIYGLYYYQRRQDLGEPTFNFVQSGQVRFAKAKNFPLSLRIMGRYFCF